MDILNGSILASVTKMSSGSAPASPNDGDIWYDSTQKCLVTFLNGVTQTLNGVMFCNTAIKSLGNVTTATSLFPAGWGTTTLPANFWSVGKAIRIRFKNVYSSSTLTTGATIVVSLGGVTIATANLTALANNATNLASNGELTILCTAIGTTGKIQCGGGIDFTTGMSGKVFADLSNSGAESTINTTTAATLDVTCRFNSSTANQDVKVLIANIEIIK